jgi:hypothetical protein
VEPFAFGSDEIIFFKTLKDRDVHEIYSKIGKA